MSIKITLGQLTIARDTQALAHISALIPPGGYQFRVAKLFDAVECELKGYERQRLGLFKTYGVHVMVEKEVDGKKTYVMTADLTLVGAPPENVLAFNTAFIELLAIETTIPYEPIAWTKLGAEAQAKLTINDVRALGPLLVDDSAA